MRNNYKYPHESVDYLLKIVWQNVANKYNTLVVGHGISQSIGYLLLNIDEAEGTTVSQAAQLLGLKTTSLSRMLNQLEQGGLIYRNSNEGDKRSVKIFLTPAGIEKKLFARKTAKDFNNYLNSHLNAKEKEQLTTLLKKVNALTLNYYPDEQ
jgi:MarR family transcriptional regulator, organic hydroperoxide resistance regulator